jgi:hypothetical protein
MYAGLMFDFNAVTGRPVWIGLVFSPSGAILYTVVASGPFLALKYADAWAANHGK